MARRPRVLILDVASSDVPALQDEIQRTELDLRTFYSAARAQRYLERRRVDLILADPACAGSIELLRWVRSLRPHTPVILLSREPALEAALLGLRHGAFDYLSRPVSRAEMQGALDRVLSAGRREVQSRRLQRLLDFPRRPVGEARGAGWASGCSGLDLIRALERDEFELFFQPRMDARTLNLCGFEALLRWNSPERGWISPEVFIPVAERTGVIVELGRWVLQRAAAQAASWARAGRAFVRISVNVSARQFEGGRLLADFTEALESDSALAPQMFELEITESALLHGIDEAARTLRAVAALGVSVALDDFGVGYSSLIYLHRLPLNVIKIDRSFRELDLRVVAEGVESEAHIAVLQSMGCDELQGFWFSRPAPAAAFAAWFRTEAHPV